MHEKYDVSQTKNDIGLIRLTRKIPENKHVNFISLPTRAEANENLVGKIGLISGFGLYSDGKLIKTKFRLNTYHETICFSQNPMIFLETYGGLKFQLFQTSFVRKDIRKFITFENPISAVRPMEEKVYVQVG